MKNLDKILINPEKLIKDKELINLRGGSEECPIQSCPPGQSIFWCECTSGPGLWCGCYESQEAAEDSLDVWCAPPPNGNCWAG